MKTTYSNATTAIRIESDITRTIITPKLAVDLNNETMSVLSEYSESSFKNNDDSISAVTNVSKKNEQTLPSREEQSERKRSSPKTKMKTNENETQHETKEKNHDAMSESKRSNNKNHTTGSVNKRDKKRKEKGNRKTKGKARFDE